MKTTLTVSSLGFSGMVRELTKAGGVPMAQGVRQGVALVLNAAIKGQVTKLSGQKKMNRRRTDRLTAKLNTISREGAGRVDYHLGGRTFRKADGLKSSIGARGTWIGQGPKGVPGNWHLIQPGRRIPDALWAESQALDSMRRPQLNQQLKLALSDISKAYGLSATAWYQIAQNLGIESLIRGVPKYVKTARPSNGRVHQNGTGREVEAADTFYIEISNDSPLTVGRKGAEVLEQAMRNSLIGVGNAIRHDTFSNIKARAQRYPGIFVS